MVPTILLPFLSSSVLAKEPVKTHLTTANIHNTGLQNAATQLQNNIQTAITNLTKSDTELKTKIAQVPTGTDVSAAQTAITNLESQITIIKGLVVPTAPASSTDLVTVRQSFQTARDAAHKDVTTANQALRGVLQTVNQLTHLKTQGDKAIATRVTSLNAKITKINALKNLSDTQKSSFISQFQTRINTLNSLKIKLDADTDPVVAKADYQSIFTDNRIFAIFEPQMNIMMQADSLIARANVLLAKTTDTTKQAKLNDAIAQANAAINAVASLTPANYPATSTFTTARGYLKLAQADIKAAH